MNDDDLALRNLTYARLVELGRRQWWYGNCAWDAFGICAKSQLRGNIASSEATRSADLRFAECRLRLVS